MARVVIDTDGVRVLAQYTRGAIDEVVKIRTELLRCQKYLDYGPGADAFSPLLGALTDYCTVLDADNRQLVAAVTSIEQEEGVAPVSVAPDGKAVATTPGVSSALLLGGIPTLIRPTETAPPPRPWNTNWVTPGGVIPIGGPTRTVSPGGPSTDADATETWQTKAEADNALGHNSSGAGGQVHVSGGMGGWESHDGRGDTTYNWEDYQKAVAEGHAQISGNLGDLNYNAEVHGETGAEQQIHVWAKGGPDGYSGGAEAHAKVYIEGGASGHADMKEVGSIDGNIAGNAKAEANAHTEAGVSDRGAEGGAGADAFTGANAQMGGKGELGPIKGGREIEVGTGVGVGASGHISMSLDDIGFDFSGELGLGISLGAMTSLHFSPSGFVHGVEAMFDGDNPMDASDNQWQQQDADAAQADADQRGFEQQGDMVNQDANVGDRAPTDPKV
jgi:hypothetical protein